MSFEANLARLNEIVEQLDGDGVELNAALSLFEEGIELLRKASEELTVAEGKVTLLTERADGVFATETLRDR